MSDSLWIGAEPVGKNRGDYKREVENWIGYLNEKYPDLHLYYLAISSQSHVVCIKTSVLKQSTGPKPLCDFLEGFMCGLRQSKDNDPRRTERMDGIARDNRFRTRPLFEM